MILRFEESFEKDLLKLKDKKVKKKLTQVIQNLKRAEKLHEISNLKKLEGYKYFYRIRLGNYRIGLEKGKDILIITRILLRKDIYKYFP